MYICTDCGYSFAAAEKIVEQHAIPAPPYECRFVCPACKSENFHKQNTDYCRFCGARLKNGALDYCSDTCRRRGRLAHSKEKRRKNLLYNSDIYKKVRAIDEYNRKNKIKLSYGQYVALVDKGDK